jgi:energy-converting hydrogenase Eha subunit C
MLLLIPVLLYFLSAVAIAVWHIFRRGFGVPWLSAVAVTILGWGGMIFLRFRIPVTLAGQQWLGIGEAAQYPYFLLDDISWPYAFALCGLAVGAIFTASARLAYRSNPLSWAAILALCGAGLLAVTAADPLTLAMSWTAIDMIELVLLLATVRNSDLSQRVVLAFSARVLGTMVLLWAVLFARSQGIDLNLTQIPPGVGPILLLAAGLRLGVLPLHLTLQTEIPMRRGLGTMLRSAALTTLAVAYSALKWLFAEDAVSGRPYWLIGMSGLALLCVLRGRPETSTAWGLALLLPGGLLFLYSARERGTLVFALLGALGLASLPFTPAAAGWLGLASQPFDAAAMVFVLLHAVLLGGYLRHAFAPGETLRSMDRWVQSVYPFGLLMLVITQWVAAWFGLPLSFGLATWVGTLSTLLALGGFALGSRVSSAEGQGPGWLNILGGRIGGWLGAIFRLDWLYRLGVLFYGAVRRLIAFLTTILEGDGGVLWALVLLALLFSLLSMEGGAP